LRRNHFVGFAKNKNRIIGGYVSYIDVELVSESRRANVKTRASTFIGAKCVDGRGVEHSIRIRNLSETGMGGECVSGFGLCKGQSVTVLLRESTWATGEVVWTDGRRFGMVFDHAFGAADLNIKAWWTGPSFEVSALHAPVASKGRPPITSA
jgi:hypothetical protein